ncbi:MAG: hypothetical protein D6690_12865 [Nitrospirae bacterium]|nr:MAG: hypothetical protein D6690_12865 [Nitrospirota bacterium]
MAQSRHGSHVHGQYDQYGGKGHAALIILLMHCAVGSVYTPHLGKRAVKDAMILAADGSKGEIRLFNMLNSQFQ